MKKPTISVRPLDLCRWSLSYAVRRWQALLLVLFAMILKTGLDVLVSVRRALGGADLGQLRQAVEREFLTLDEHEQSVRSALAKMEGELIRRMASFHNV